MSCAIIGFDCPEADLCKNCRGSGYEPVVDGVDLCCCCDNCFDEVIGWSTGIEPGTPTQIVARQFVYMK